MLYFSGSNISCTGGSVETVRGVTECPAPKPKEFDASEGRWRGKHGAPQDLKPLRRGLTPAGRDGRGGEPDFSETSSELKQAFMMVLDT